MITMINNKGEIHLSDLIDIKFLQKLQDSFANAMNVASITVDDKGPITKPSNFTDFCQNYIRGTELGNKRCNECDIEGGKIAAEKGEPYIYTCHTGLAHFVVPIIVNGEHIASILGGQIALDIPDEEHFKNIAKELDIKDEGKYLKALKKIKVISKDKIKSAVKLLFLFANAISEIAHSNYELMEKNKREVLTIQIVEKIRSTLDEETIKRYFIDITQKYFNADRCLFVDFDKNKNKFMPFRLEKLKSSDIKSLVGVDLEEEFPEFCNKLKRGKDIIIRDLERTLSRNKLLGYNALKTLKESEAKSDYGLLVKCREEIAGILIIHFIKEKKVLTHDEFDFLKIIREHAGTAICQSELYLSVKQKEEKERILFDITNKIRNTLDIKTIKNEIVNQLGHFLNANGVRIADYDYETEDYIVTEESEYRANDSVKSMVGLAFKNIPGFYEHITKVHLSGEDIIFSNLEEYLDEKKIRGSGLEDFYRKFNFISAVSINIYYGDIYIGDFVITFNYPREFSSEDIDFLKALADQTGTAFYQAKLYEKEKTAVEKEIILREITDKIRNSLDIGEIKYKIVNQVGKLFNADRVVIAYYDYEVNNYIITKEAEYRSSDKVKTFEEVAFTNTPGFIEYIRNIHFQGKDIIFDDLDKYLAENNYKNTEIEKFYRDFGFMASAAINIYYEETFLGDLVVTFENKRKITQNEINFLKIIADQAGVAFHQAILFNEKNRIAENEKVLRKIMLSSVKSLDFKEVINSIVTEAGKYFKADRCFFVEIDSEKDVSKPIEAYAEYLSSEKIMSHTERAPKKEETQNFIKLIKEHKTIFVNDINKVDLPKATKKFLIDDMTVKSYLVAPVYYGNIVYGGIVLHYVDKFKTFTQEDIYMANAIANQAAIIINQAKLYEKQKNTAEKEFLLRNVTETIRSTLDIAETKRKIVEIVGETLKADRCFIVEYNKNEDKFLVVEDEYIISEDIVCYKGYDPNITAPHFIAAFKEGKTLLIQNKEMFIDNQNIDFEIEKEVIDKLKINSAFSCPLYYKNELQGVLSTHYVRDHLITNDEINLIKAIADQVAIAIHQAKLYKTTQEFAQRENLLRTITEAVRTSLDFEETKKKIVDIIGETLKADRCFIVEYNKSNDKFLIVNEEYRSSDAILSYKGVDLNENIPSLVSEFKAGKRFIINQTGATMNGEKVDLEHEDFEDAKKAIQKYSVNSALVFPLFYSKEFLGDLVLHYVEKQKQIGEDDINFLNLISNQIALALHQSKLYVKVQLQAEREKISRNIIEILRSTLDKNMIEHLFVINIGKYFSANRVFFSEFDNKIGKYLPILEKSEYLSSPEEKSFAFYDFSSSEMGNYLQKLLEKRELMIPNWDNYIEKNTETPEILSLYKEANVKSSYSFPVLYEGNIMGYFCIQFTNKITELLEEDINRIRSICTQAGIALYHAELYLKAQEALHAKGKLIEKVQTGIKEPVDNIIKTSQILSEVELEHDKQKEYLTNIIGSCNQLLELTKDISGENEYTI